MDSWMSKQNISIKRELSQLMYLAGPAIVISSSATAMSATDQIMVGHLGRDVLAAASVGNTWYNLLFFFQLGFGTALDTLAAQAFGAQNGTAMWSATITAVLTGTVAAVPMIVALLLTRPVAHYLFAQPPAIAQQTAAFCTRLVPGVLPQILATLLVKVLLAQNEMLAPALLGASGVLVNIGTNLMFIRWYGFLGAPIATTISRVLLLLGAIAVLAHSQHCKTSQTPPGKILYTLASDSGDRIVLTSADSEQDINVSTLESQDVAPSEAVRLAHERTDTLVPPDDAGAPASQSVEQISALKAACMASVSWEKVWRQAVEWKSIWEYLKLAIPGGFMVAMESSSFDITTVMAGTLGVAEVDAHIALLTVNAFTFVSFPFGIATAATIRVGNLLGAKCPKQAATSAWCAVACGGLSMMICAIATYLLRHRIGSIFIDDAQVADLVAMIAPYGAFLMFFDGVMGTAQGALRGVGHQMKILFFNAAGFWGVGVSTGVVLTFVTHWGLRGVWIGIMLGVMSTCILNVVGLLALNWQRSVESCSSSTAGATLPGDSADKKHEAQSTSWGGAVWEAVSHRVLEMPSRQQYSRGEDVHEMDELVSEPSDTR